VNKGDSLYQIAAHYLTTPGNYVAIQKLNRIRNPRRMLIGFVLQVPRALLRQEAIYAKVKNFSGSVLVGAKIVTAGMVLEEGAVIETGMRSFITLYLPDGSLISLPSNASIRIERLRRTLLTDALERRFAIRRGQATGKVTPMTDPDSSFQFKTPRVITSVRGTLFRTAYEPDSGSSRVEVVEGKVAFRANRNSEELVPAGFGISEQLLAPVGLLPSPSLANPGKVQDEEGLTFPVEPVAGAIAYHLQIARDAGFSDVIDETVSERPEGEFPGIANGNYFVRTTAIDANRLEGRPSIYSFDRRLNRLRTSIEQGRAGRYRQFLFRWDAPDMTDGQFRFQLSRSADGAGALVDQAGLKGSSFIITDLPPGIYHWRVMSMSVEAGRVFTKWSPSSELRIEASK